MRNQCTVKIGGKKRVLVFNMNSDQKMCEGLSLLTGRPVLSEELISFLYNGTEEDGSIVRHENMIYRNAALIWMVYSGLHNQYERTNDMEGIEEISYHKVADWIADLSKEDNTTIANCFMSTRILKKESNNGQSRKGETAKKK